MDHEKESFEHSIARRLLNLEQHVINLIIPIQNLTNLISSNDFLRRLHDIQQMPIKIDDRFLKEVLDKFYGKFESYKDFVKEFSSEKTLAEIKYIGKKLNEIEEALKQIKEKGLRKSVELNFKCDGYELVQKPQAYDVNDPKEKPITDEKMVKELLETMTERERYTLIHFYGLFGSPKLKPTEIAKKFKIKSRQQIYLIKNRALRKCRHKNRQKFLKYIDNEELKSDIGFQDFDCD